MTSFYLPLIPFFVSLFWAIMIFFMPYRRYPAKMVMGATLFVLAFSFVIRAVIFNEEDNYYTNIFSALYVLLMLLRIPLFYLYVYLMTSVRKFRPSILLVLLPSLVYGFVYFVLGMILKYAAVDESYVKVAKVAYIMRTQLLAPSSLIQVLLTIYASIKRIRWFRIILREYYSNENMLSLLSLQKTMIVFSMGFVAESLAFYIFKTNVSSMIIPSLFAYILFGVIIFIMGSVSYRTPMAVFELSKAVYEDAKNEDSILIEYSEESEIKQDHKVDIDPLLPANYLQIQQTMIRLMHDKQLFREPDLRINDLASAMNIGTTYVSRILNKSMHTSFSEWVNENRILYAQNLMASNDDLSMPEVAAESGFASVNSFHRVYKSKMGITPYKWKTKIKA